MKRRSFLGLLGGAAAAGPSNVANAVTPQALKLRHLGIAGTLARVDEAEPSDAGRVEHAKQRLKQLIGWGSEARAMRRRRYWLDGLEPDVAALRSVALSQKVRISRRIAFERDEATQQSYLEGVIAGLWE